MAITILQEPPALSFVGNLPDIIGHSTETVAENFTLSVDSVVILEETYVPDGDGKIVIRIRELLDTQLSIGIPIGSLYAQDDAVKDVECLLGVEPVDFRIIKGGVDRKSLNSLDFLASNWLTWQPQSKTVKYQDPEWLSYYPLENVNVRVKAYFEGGTDQTMTKEALTADTLYTINVNFQHVRSLFTAQPIYFDIWVESLSGSVLSFVQRYVLTDEIYDFDDLFIFENSLGGLDTVRFTGQKELLNASKFDAAIFFDEIELDYGVIPDKAFEKNTGWFHSKRALAWSQDFFSSLQKYVFEKGNLVRILVKEPEVTDIKYALIEFDFKYIYTRQTKYLDLVSEEDFMGLLIIIGPDDEQYYLVPKLWEFPVLTDPSQALFPVQTTDNAQWQTLSFQTILNYILANIDIPGAETGYRVINPGRLVINSSTSATLTGAQWVHADGPFSYTGPVPLTGSPTNPNNRFDILTFGNLGIPMMKTGANAPDPVVPNPEAGTMLGHTIYRPYTGEDVVIPVNPKDPATAVTIGMTGKYAPIWSQSVGQNNFHGFKISFLSWSSDYGAFGQFPSNGFVLVDFVTGASNTQIDPNRVSVRCKDIGVDNGDFVLVQTGPAQVTLYTKKKSYLGNMVFQFVAPRHETVLASSLVNGGAYGDLPSGAAAYPSHNGRDYISSSLPVRMDINRQYGLEGTPIAGSITFPATMGDVNNAARVDTNVMVKLMHNAPAEPSMTMPAGVWKRCDGGEYAPNTDNMYYIIAHKNSANTVIGISYTITQNTL